MRILLLTLVLLFSATFTVQQKTFDDLTRETQAWLFDEPSATYKLSARGRAVSFCNRTSKNVMGFRLGCVKKKDGELSVLSGGDFEERFLLAVAGEYTTCASWVASHGFPLSTGCEKGEFAVTEVKLEDGTTWELKP